MQTFKELAITALVYSLLIYGMTVVFITPERAFAIISG